MRFCTICTKIAILLLQIGRQGSDNSVTLLTLLEIIGFSFLGEYRQTIQIPVLSTYTGTDKNKQKGGNHSEKQIVQTHSVICIGSCYGIALGNYDFC